ncbi:hypothetical protein CIHG_03912 [Coccidioides immitis H538.4]|uniref:Uncharacterized protein n=3 Tax=Coccidioides immitis TaxID=5501 RepID=A0A0J8QUJ6_COCIT|nr:hypothetical protein CIRG_03664 [Coccidioides immitis RMSCC 2394]KMU74943.1 hypothetical protein CISG_00872 [Coccidioides immitis RMSCC 3703]KMU86124.1 hypothetical protein CIHG_03912 [Coccidioides immitis H538.4]
MERRDAGSHLLVCKFDVFLTFGAGWRRPRAAALGPVGQGVPASDFRSAATWTPGCHAQRRSDGGRPLTVLLQPLPWDSHGAHRHSNYTIISAPAKTMVSNRHTVSTVSSLSPLPLSHSLSWARQPFLLPVNAMDAHESWQF